MSNSIIEEDKKYGMDKDQIKRRNIISQFIQAMKTYSIFFEKAIEIDNKLSEYK